MSFYSALVLTANKGVKNITNEAVQSIFARLNLFEPFPPFPSHLMLSSRICSLMDDTAAREENKRFFSPGELSFRTDVVIEGVEGCYEGRGWSILIHGNGYFYPWEMKDFKLRVTSSPDLVALRAEIQKVFGGEFRYPKRHEEYLRSRWIDGEDGWVWFGSESL